MGILKNFRELKMKAATIVMIIFTVILFLCVAALAFMNIASSLSATKVPSNALFAKAYGKMQNGKVFNKWISLGVSGLTLIVVIILTITGATAEKEAFTRIYTS